jgi:RNA 3'-terminal phosphate cyclase
MALAPLELGPSPGAPVLDAALAIALATGAPLRLEGPLQGADAALVLAAVKLCAPDSQTALDAARLALSRSEPAELPLGRPRAGSYALPFEAPGGVARAVLALTWPLALTGKPSTLRLYGPNHGEHTPTFHELRLCWAQLASRFGLKISLELTAASFDGEDGELVAELDPAPALTPLQLVHRGLLQQVTVVAATTGGSHGDPLRAAQRAARRLRAHGIIAEAERVPLPHVTAPTPRSRWALTGLAEFEKSLVCASAVPPASRGEPARLPGPPDADGPAEEVGDRVAERLATFVSRRGALDGPTAERLLVPALLCAAGLGARAGPPPACHFTTSEVTEGLLAVAQLARRVLPVRAVVDGGLGEEGVVVVTPFAQ